MALLLELLIVFVLSAIFIQDLKDHSVYWFWFPALVCLFVLDAHFIHHQSFRDLGYSTGMDLVFLALLLLLLSLYLSVRRRKWVNITEDHLCWGDILFLISIAFYLSVLNYLFFYISSLVIICVSWTLLKILSKKKHQYIPLAGLQAMILIVFLVIGSMGRKIGLTNDDWLLHYLYRWTWLK